MVKFGLKLWGGNELNGKILGIMPTSLSGFAWVIQCGMGCGALLSSVENYQWKIPNCIQNNSASSLRPI